MTRSPIELFWTAKKEENSQLFLLHWQPPPRCRSLQFAFFGASLSLCHLTRRHSWPRCCRYLPRQCTLCRWYCPDRCCPRWFLLEAGWLSVWREVTVCQLYRSACSSVPGPFSGIPCLAWGEFYIELIKAFVNSLSLQIGGWNQAISAGHCERCDRSSNAILGLPCSLFQETSLWHRCFLCSCWYGENWHCRRYEGGGAEQVLPEDGIGIRLWRC